MAYQTMQVTLRVNEGQRLEQYAKDKGRSASSVLRQALRVDDWIEQTPGAYDAVNALARDGHGLTLHPNALPMDTPGAPPCQGVGGFVPFESRGGVATIEQIDQLCALDVPRDRAARLVMRE